MLHFELSTMIGRRAISGSVATMSRNFAIDFSPSSIPSSMFTSRMFAPPRTWSSATVSAFVKSPLRMSSMNFAEPVTFVRSPIIVKFDSGVIEKTSRPEKRDVWSVSGGFRGDFFSTARAIARM